MKLQEIIKDHQLVIYDGECNLCDSSVQFIIKRDTNAFYKFIASHHPEAQKILKEKFPEDIPDSVILINSDGLFIRSAAMTRIVSKLPFPWKIFGLGRFIPPILLDPFYRLLAVTRKKIWGYNEQCDLTARKFADRFIQ